MKNILIAIICFCLAGSSSLSAQGKKPAAKPSKADSISQATGIKEFDVNGIKVIMKPAVNNVVNVQLFITGGVKNYTAEKQGVEQMALSVLTDGGSEKYPKEDYHALLERKGIAIGGSAGFDYSTISMQTLNLNWEQSWDVFQDLILNPSWNDQSFQQIQQQIISGLQQAEADPDTRITDMTMAGIFKGKDYEKMPNGTVESVSALTMEDIKAHYNNILQKNKMIMVIVGSVNEADVRKKVQMLGSLPAGTADKFVSNPITINKPDVVVEPREIATNYIIGVAGAPVQGTREAIAMRMAMAMLSERLFVEIRTKRNLSYAPRARMASLFNPYSYVYVTTTKPTESVQVMKDEVKKILTDGFTAKELANQKETYLTSYYMNQETNGAQASMLGISELVNDWTEAVEFNNTVRSLTLEEITNAFRKHAQNITWFYLGDPGLVENEVYTNPIK